MNIKQIKIKFHINERIINNKYQIRKENIELLYKYKKEKLDKKYYEILNKISIDKEIENIANIKELNDLIYNTYNCYKNNYYNSKNINNLIMNFHKNNKYIRENIRKKLTENEYNIMLDSLYEIKKNVKAFENNNDNNKEMIKLYDDIKEKEKQFLILEKKLKVEYEKKIEKIKKENNLTKL